ncbi:MAG: hypothetical protein V7L01_11280 [Nostoc sp.]|uniref:hypothetical protein n=1 Tax=Nostoc sp. TaxID=1180 RepID=UPI002FF46FE8
MVKPVSAQRDRLDTYQQALDDFGITELLSRLSNFSDPDFDAAYLVEKQELENLVAILIQRLTHSLEDNLIASYLSAIQQGKSDSLLSQINVEIPPQSIDLPSHFPNVETPSFLYGDKLRWVSSDDRTDWGIAIGRFYSFAPHRCCWMWRYLIWLAKDSPSVAWTVADTAWEEDLEPLASEKDL